MKNFWSGNWLACYNVTVEGGKCIVAGEVKTWCHYFENGNVQMQQKKELEAAVVEAGSPADVAANVTKHISDCEAAVHAGLENM